MTIGSFIIVRDENAWIGPHIASSLPFLDEMVFFDGNSTDGTLETIKRFRSQYPDGQKITLVEGQDPENLRDAYVKMFTDCMRTLSTDLAIFLHPDMIVTNPEAFKKMPEGGIAYYTHIKSYAGDPGGQLYEIVDGRSPIWKHIYRLKNPDMGAHYQGWYGAWNEDVYFSKITGDEYAFYGDKMEKYPYSVMDSGVQLMHFSDVRPYERRLGRMKTCLENQRASDPAKIDEIAKGHPRVSLKNGKYGRLNFNFVPSEYPEIFKTWGGVHA